MAVIGKKRKSGTTYYVVTWWNGKAWQERSGNQVSLAGGALRGEARQGGVCCGFCTRLFTRSGPRRMRESAAGIHGRFSVSTLRIGHRIRHLPELGTVFDSLYTFRGELKVGVVWDSAPKWFASCPVAGLVLVKSEPVGVPPEARPLSIGALQAPERRHP